MEEYEEKVQNFLKENDKDKKGYVSEEEFIAFYERAVRNKKILTVWNNLKRMHIREDLKKDDEPYDIEFYPNEKLPRYQLGNDLDFIQNLIKQYYSNPEGNNILLKFLSFITTNQKIYDEVINLFNNENNNNEENFVKKILEEGNNIDNKYVELNYIFIIIESILQDLEVNLIFEKQNPINDNEISIGSKDYKLLLEKYEPFDNEENNKKKIDFFKNMIKSQNFNKIIKLVNALLIKISQEEKENKTNEELFDCCLRGIKIINIINIIYNLDGLDFNIL